MAPVFLTSETVFKDIIVQGWVTHKVVDARKSRCYHSDSEMLGNTVMREKYDFILSQEESFARGVALALIMRRPLSVWHYLIPFMFMFDFFARKRETEIFAKNFLFTKKLALDAAYQINKGEERQNTLAKIEDEIKNWLTTQNVYSWRIHQGQMAEINLLIDHYSKLLNAEGKSYDALVKNAYQTRRDYEVFLQQLTSAEKEIDRAALELLPGKEKAWEQMLDKQGVMEGARTKWVDRIF